MMSPGSISPPEAVIITASRAARLIAGPSDINYYRGMPNYNTEPFDWLTALDSFLYGGIYAGINVQSTVALSLALSNLSDGQKFTFYNSMGLWATNTLEWLTKSIAVDAEIAVAKIADGTGDLGSFGASVADVFTNSPAKRADLSHAKATKGQRFQFYMRSLKPSIWQHDLGGNEISVDSVAQAIAQNAPKGILRLPPSVSQLTESYNPTWQQQNILGSSQQHHKYQYTSRNIQMTLELYSNNLIELRYNIWRLNWMADHTYGKLSNFKRSENTSTNQVTELADPFLNTSAPTNARFAQRIEYKEYPFMKLTTGTVFIELPCYIANMNINYHMDTPWELGDDILNRINGEKSLQWPHWITVSLTLNVLYDKIDPASNNSFYLQDGTKKDTSNGVDRILSGNVFDVLDYLEWKDS